MKYFAVNTQSYINRKEDSLSSYLSDVNKYPVLTPNQEAQVVSTMRLGGKAGERAKDKLVLSNLRFVISVANKYMGMGLSRADLIQEGNMGLLEATSSYDPSMGCRFTTYAVWYIRKAILNALGKNAPIVKISGGKQRIINSFKKLERQNPGADRYILMDEFCADKSFDICELEHLLAASSKTKEADAPLGNDEDCDATFIDMMPSSNHTDAAMDKESLNTDVMRAIDTVLNSREKKVITEFYGIGCEDRSLNAIGDELGLKYEGTRKIRESALKKLMSSRISHQLSGYLAA